MEPRIRHRRAAVISDLHVEADHRSLDTELEHLLARRIPERIGAPTTLVIAGDFIAFPRILPELGQSSPGPRFGATEQESLARIQVAIERHPQVFDALVQFIARGNQVLLLPGDQDVDLHFPRVLGALRGALGDPGPHQLDFVPEGAIHERGLHVEHGNQCFLDGRFEHWRNPIIDAPDGTRRLERPWGTLFTSIVHEHMRVAYPLIGRVSPHGALAGVILPLLLDDPVVPVHALAPIVVLLAAHGKGARRRWSLGSQEEALARPISHADIEEFVSSLGDRISSRRRAALIEEAIAISGAVDDSSDPSIEARDGTSGLLGRSEEYGLAARANELIRSGTVRVVAFGHTPWPLEREVDLPGRRCRVVHTGAWAPYVEVPAGRVHSMDDLRAIRPTYDPRVLWLDLDDQPTACLEKLARCPEER